jgi:hypothetical protein
MGEGQGNAVREEGKQAGNEEYIVEVEGGVDMQRKETGLRRAMQAALNRGKQLHFCAQDY